MSLFPRVCHLAILAAAFGTVGCSGNAGFAGGSAKATTTPASTPESAAAVAAPQVTSTSAGGVPTTCGAAGITQASLATAQLQDSDPTAALDYVLSLTDCQGNAQTISSSELLFDFDGSSPGATNLNFSITDGAELNYTGKLVIVKQSDLFGRTGSNYQHYQSDNAVPLKTAATSLKVHVVIGETGVISPLNTTIVPTASFQLPTYLRLGAAAPVEKDITVIP